MLTLPPQRLSLQLLQEHSQLCFWYRLGDNASPLHVAAGLYTDRSFTTIASLAVPIVNTAGRNMQQDMTLLHKTQYECTCSKWASVNRSPHH